MGSCCSHQSVSDVPLHTHEHTLRLVPESVVTGTPVQQATVERSHTPPPLHTSPAQIELECEGQSHKPHCERHSTDVHLPSAPNPLVRSPSTLSKSLPNISLCLPHPTPQTLLSPVRGASDVARTLRIPQSSDETNSVASAAYSPVALAGYLAVLKSSPHVGTPSTGSSQPAAKHSSSLTDGVQDRAVRSFVCTPHHDGSTASISPQNIHNTRSASRLSRLSTLGSFAASRAVDALCLELQCNTLSNLATVLRATSNPTSSVQSFDPLAFPCALSHIHGDADAVPGVMIGHPLEKFGVDGGTFAADDISARRRSPRVLSIDLELQSLHSNGLPVAAQKRRQSTALLLNPLEPPAHSSHVSAAGEMEALF